MNQIVTEARKWLGTPFHHQGRLKGVGVDCLGLILGVAEGLGIDTSNIDRTDYGELPNRNLQNDIERYLHKCEIEDGAVLFFRISDVPYHLGFASDVGVIHATKQAGKVVEHRLDKFWESRICGVYKWHQ